MTLIIGSSDTSSNEAWVKLTDVTNVGTAVFDIQNLLTSSYRLLKIVLIGYGSGEANIFLTINNDSTQAKYFNSDIIEIFGGSTTAIAYDGATWTGIYLGDISTSKTNVVTATITNVAGKSKTLLGNFAHPQAVTPSNRTGILAGAFNDTSAVISRLTTSTQFLVGSRMTIYGLV